MPADGRWNGRSSRSAGGAASSQAWAERFPSLPARTSRVEASGSWKADLGSISCAHGRGCPLAIAGTRRVSGTSRRPCGSSAAVDAKFTVEGNERGHSLSASVHADVDSFGGFTFTAPITITLGTSVSLVASEGSWSRDNGVTRVDVTLTSERVTEGHVGVLCAALAAAGGVALPSGVALPGRGARTARHNARFWGNLVGSVKYSFARLEVGGHGVDYAGGLFEIEPGVIRLLGGHASLPHQNMLRAEGTLAFDAKAEDPYVVIRN